MNDLLQEDIPAGRFVTAVVGILDSLNFHMWLSSAGQASLYFYRAATGEMYGLDCLREFINQNATQPSKEFVVSLYADVLCHADGKSQPDDVTIV